MTKTADQHTNEGTWYRKWPRRFFRYPIWVFSVYVGVGYLLVGILHLQIWMQSERVATIFTSFGFEIGRPTPKLALLLFVITGVTASTIYYRLLRRSKLEGGNLELVFWGTIASLVLAWIPWLYASSVVNTLFLFLFGMSAIVGFGMANLVTPISRNGDECAQPDPWKMFLVAAKGCATVIVVLIGAVATSVLLPWRNTDIEGMGLFRYALLSAYVMLGMLAFVLMPLLVRSLDQTSSQDTDLDLPGPPKGGT